MIDMPRAHALGKAAMVIIAEAEMVGLRKELEVKAKQDIRENGAFRTYNYRIDAKVTGGGLLPRESFGIASCGNRSE